MSLLSEGAGLARPLRGEIARAEPSMAGVGDYLALMKPRVMSLVVFTALTGLLVAPGHLHPVLAFTALLCIAVGAGAAGALNMWYDADIDAVMTRTAARPIPAGRIQPSEALGFGMTLAVGSVVMLGLMINVLAAGLLAFTILFYVVVYTMWLKRWTPQNIVIGGAAGASPPMIGWAATTGGIGVESVLLVLIIFFWTPPHFWALSLLRADEYARAGVPMLPVVAGAAETRRQILIYSLVLAPIGASPWLFGYAGSGLWHRRDPRRRADDRVVVAIVAHAVRSDRQASVRLLDPLSLRPVRRAVGRAGIGRLDRPCLRMSLLMAEKPTDPGIVLTEEQKRQRRARSIAIALSPWCAGFADLRRDRRQARSQRTKSSAVSWSYRMSASTPAPAAATSWSPVAPARLRRSWSAWRMPRCRSTTGSVAPPASAARPKSQPRRPRDVLDRKITIHFDANVSPGLPWRFEPERTSIEARLGEVITVDYRAII